MKKTTSLILLTFVFFTSIAQNPQGFFLENWQEKTSVSPPYINTAQSAEPATIKVTVDFQNKLTKISKYVYGNNGVNWAGKMNKDAALMKKISDLNPHVLRWPGGNLSNEHFWNAVQNGGPSDIPSDMQINPLNAGMNTTNWAMTVTEYYDMLTKTNTEGCICVNYSYARYGTSDDPVATAAHYAAEWVRYDNGRTKFWEIGNENMGSWQAGYEIDTTLNKDGQPKFISGDLYGKHARVFIDSMKSAAAEIGSEIKIGVCLLESTVTWDPVMKDWNKLLLPVISDKADFLVIHSYYTPYNQNSGVATILNSAAHTKNYKDFVLKDLKTYGKIDNLPIALTEWNIFAVGSKQAVSYINGMHATLVLGEVIKNQYGQANRWDLMNGWSDGNDHGLFARSDEPGMSYGVPHAPFYYMYYFQKYFGDHLVSSSVTGSNNVVCYASSFSSGESGVVLVNKGNTKQVVNLQMNNFEEAKSYYRYVLTGGTDNGDFSRKVFVNGIGPTSEGGGPSNYETLEAFGKSIFGDIKIETPPLSVTYVLLTKDIIPPLTEVKSTNTNSFKIYPNPAANEITINKGNIKFNKIEIVNLNGEKVFEQIFEDPGFQTKKLNFNLNSGVYILNIYSKDNCQSKKLIVK